MGSVLTEIEYDSINQEQLDQMLAPIKIWIEEDNITRPSTDIKLRDKLNPGFYSIDVNTTYGIHCRPEKINSDELFIFHNNKINELLSEIDLFWSKKDIYDKNKLIHKRGILLEGFPGTGKTSIISLLCQKIISKGGVIFNISSPKNLFYYVSFIRDFFRKIEPDTPIITIIEDIDTYTEVFPDLLNLLDGTNNINHNLIIATSNNTEQIDNTLLRPSRIDLIIEVDLPDENIRKEYLLNKNIPQDDIDYLVTNSQGFSLADMKELYICIYILDYSPEEAILKLKNEYVKKNYLNRENNNGSYL
jgi:hypothetical protein